MHSVLAGWPLWGSLGIGQVKSATFRRSFIFFYEVIILLMWCVAVRRTVQSTGPLVVTTASGSLGRGWMAGRGGRLSTVWPWSRWFWTRNVLISDRAELILEVPKWHTLGHNLWRHLILIQLNTILQNVVLLPHRVAVLLGGNNTWLTGHHMEMMNDLDLWEFPKHWCKETCTSEPQLHRCYPLQAGLCCKWSTPPRVTNVMYRQPGWLIFVRGEWRVDCTRWQVQHRSVIGFVTTTSCLHSFAAKPGTLPGAFWASYEDNH